MAETKEEKTVVDSIKNDETIKELEVLGTKIHDLINSDEYKEFIKMSDKLNTKLLEDNVKIEKTGKSDYTQEQRTLMSSQLCSMGAVDATLGTLMNILDLRYHVEVDVAAYKAANKTKTE
jgi:hypothetical protein